MEQKCNWCHRPAVTQTIRTVKEDGEEESRTYHECEECSRLATEQVTGRYTMLCTVPDDDADYCKWFIVKTEWLKSWLQEENDGELNDEELQEVLESFLENYTWDETWWAYQNAKSWDAVISEGHDK